MKSYDKIKKKLKEEPYLFNKDLAHSDREFDKAYEEGMRRVCQELHKFCLSEGMTCEPQE